MKREIIVCDRCEREITDKRSLATVTIRNQGPNGPANDLCTDCMGELRVWLRTPARRRAPA